MKIITIIVAAVAAPQVVLPAAAPVAEDVAAAGEIDQPTAGF